MHQHSHVGIQGTNFIFLLSLVYACLAETGHEPKSHEMRIVHAWFPAYYFLSMKIDYDDDDDDDDDDVDDDDDDDDFFLGGQTPEINLPESFLF